MNVNILDILIIIPVLLFAIQGFRKGIIIEITTLIALILGVYSAIFFSDIAAGVLVKNFNISREYLSVVSFIVTFIVVLIIVMIIGKFLEKLVNVLLLALFNKLIGAVFGIFKGALLVSIIIFLINFFDSNSTIIKEKSIKESLFYNKVQPIAPWIFKKLDVKKIKNYVPDSKTIKTV